MTLNEMLESLGLDPDVFFDDESMTQDEETQLEELLSSEVYVHFQPNYPLRGKLLNAKKVDGKPVLAIGDGFDYGSRTAWEEDYES